LTKLDPVARLKHGPPLLPRPLILEQTMLRRFSLLLLAISWLVVAEALLPNPAQSATPSRP
jgi:hypothetical protein